MIDLTAVIEQYLDPPDPNASIEVPWQDAAELAAEVRAARAVVDAARLVGQPHLDETDVAEHLAARVAAYDRVTSAPTEVPG